MPSPYNYDHITKVISTMLKGMFPDGICNSELLRHDHESGNRLLSRKWSREELQPIADMTSMPCILDDAPTFYQTVKSGDPTNDEFGCAMIWIDIPEYRLHRDDNHPCIIVKWPNGRNRLLVTATRGKITKWEEFDENGGCEVSEVYFPYLDSITVTICC